MASGGLRLFRKWNRIIHRDFGYFFFGMTLIYAISGIALNHKHQWNPNYSITYQDFSVDGPVSKDAVTEEWVLALLAKYNEEKGYKKFYIQKEKNLKVFINNGTISLDLENGNGYIEKLSKRPFFFQVNFLHYNPGKWWLWFSDIYCVSLVLIAISGLFIIAKSKNSLTRRGIWFVAVGLLIPILALFFL